MMSASVKRRSEKEEERLNFIRIKVRRLRDGRVLLWERRRRQKMSKQGNRDEMEVWQ